jgi:putative spermidine/putrescine transport system substrate-binding protein
MASKARRVVRRNRRLALLGALVVASAAASVGCGSSTTDGVVFAGYGGPTQEYMQEAWFQAFSNDSGNNVEQTSPAPWAKLHAMSEADNVAWDVMWVAFDDDLNTNEYLADIDCDVVACSDFDGPVPMQKQAVPFLLTTVALTYSTEAFPDDAPSSWADFFDMEKYPGKRVIYYTPGASPLSGVLEYALIASGVPQDEVYPLDIDRALAELDKIKGNIIFTSDANQCPALISSGEAVMGDCWSGKTQTAIQAGDPLSYSKNVPIIEPMYLVVPKGAPHPEAAMELIAYMTSKKHNGGLVPYIRYDPANPHADIDEKYLDELIVVDSEKTGPSAPLTVDDQWWLDNRDSFNERVTEWVNSQ